MVMVEGKNVRLAVLRARTFLDLKESERQLRSKLDPKQGGTLSKTDLQTIQVRR